MKTIFCIITMVLFTLMPEFVLSAPLNESAGYQLKQNLSEMNISDFELDLNVRVSIPEINSVPAVDLWAIILRPNGSEKLPTILIATCYRREFIITLGANLVTHGYNVMCLDIRGSGSSQGTWPALDLAEHSDITYVIDQWIPSQHWSDGSVGMLGPSYMGISQFLAAGNIERDETGQPTHLKAIFPYVPMSDAFDDIVMQGGNCDVEFILFWLVGTDFLSILPPLIGNGGLPDIDIIQEAADIWLDHIQALPVHLDWIMDPAHMTYGAFYQNRSTMMYWPDKPQDWPSMGDPGVIPSKLPVFQVGGWFDIFTRGTLNHYQYGLKNHDSTDKAMIVGPWYHLDGSMGLGIDGLMFSQEIPLRWFNWKLKGIHEPFMQEFPVVTYVMGEDRWRAEKDWPLPNSRLKDMTYYLSKQKPSLIDGDWFSGLNRSHNYLLSADLNIADYSGDNPVLWHNPPVLHGLQSRSSVRWSIGLPAIASQASKLLLDEDIDHMMPWEDERLDELGVLTFTTEALMEDLEIAGPLALTFWARTMFTRELSAQIAHETSELIKDFFNVDGNLMLDLMDRKDVQWVVELNDVYPDGRSRNITSGWLSAWHRPYDPDEDPYEQNHHLDPAYTPFDPFYIAPHKNPKPINEGELYPYVVELWPTDTAFKAGHRVRISISASDFPHLLPVLHPSKNIIVLDETHPALLDFKAVTGEDEGITWKWIDDINQYLLTHVDAQQAEEEEETEEVNPEKQESSHSSGTGHHCSGCFINTAGL